jgi:hypothetical protein
VGEHGQELVLAPVLLLEPVLAGPQRLLGQLAGAGVLDDPDAVERFAGRVPDGRGGHVDPDRVPVRADEALLQGVGRKVAGHEPGVQLLVLAGVVRVGQVATGATDQVPLGIAGQLAELRIDAEEPAVRAGLAHPDGGTLVDGPELALALAQAGVGIPPVGHGRTTSVSGLERKPDRHAPGACRVGTGLFPSIAGLRPRG